MIEIKNLPTQAPEDLEKKTIVKKTQKYAKGIGKLSRLLEANADRNFLIVLQGMDASGKDGVTREVFKYCSPASTCAISFKKPTPEEFAHDFLWRIHKNTPAKGKIKIFIRSHYEDVLIQRVHKWIDENQVDMRFHAINAFEDLLQKDNRTIILKFFLHISPERQLEKLQERLTEEDKLWKHNPGDWEERKLWKDYMKCYEDLLNRSRIPWTVIPSDQRWYRNYLVAKTVYNAMKALRLTYPLLKEE